MDLPTSRSFVLPRMARTAFSRKTFTVNSLGLTPNKKSKFHTEKGDPKVGKEILFDLVGRLGDPKGTAFSQLTEVYGEDQAKLAAKGLRAIASTKTSDFIMSGFANPILLRHLQSDERIHPKWALDTSTGRLACRSPNLQNLPSTASDRYKLRCAFVARDDNVFLVADYAQLELRILAHMSKCTNMADKLARGGDFHSEVAVDMFPHVRQAVDSGEVFLGDDGPPGSVSVKSKFSAERVKAKAINFGVAYGKEAPSLSEDLNITVAEAEDLVARWYADKQEILRWKRGLIQYGRTHGRSYSLLGRWRTLPHITRRDVYWARSRTERAAVNFGVQGSAADIVLSAMLRVWHDCRAGTLSYLGFRIVMQVHDEIVLEGPRKHAEEAVEILREFMSNPFGNAFQLIVPLTVDIAISPNFGEAK